MKPVNLRKPESIPSCPGKRPNAQPVSGPRSFILAHHKLPENKQKHAHRVGVTKGGFLTNYLKG